MTDINDGTSEPTEEEEVIDLFADGADDLLSDEQPDEVQAVEGTDDAPAKEADADPAIPDKFKGKSAAEIAASYADLEKEYGRRSNEIGELRKITDDILKAQLTPKAEEDEQLDVTSDDLLADPAGVVARAVANSPEVVALREQKAKQDFDASLERFKTTHADAATVIGSEQFQNWVNSNPVRAARYAKANDGYDFDTASEIISTYKEVFAVAAETTEAERKAALKDVASAPAAGAGNPGAAPKKKYLLRTELMKLKQTDPDRYERLQPQIIQAYAEGRVK